VAPRAIGIPTPRRTAYDRVEPELDLPPEIPLKIRERAYTSPIWYTPPGGGTGHCSALNAPMAFPLEEVGSARRGPV
jgi:hypothetical protein